MNGLRKNIQQGLTELIEEAVSTMVETTLRQLFVASAMRAIQTTTYGFRSSFFVALDSGSDA